MSKDLPEAIADQSSAAAWCSFTTSLRRMVRASAKAERKTPPLTALKYSRAPARHPRTNLQCRHRLGIGRSEGARMLKNRAAPDG